LALVARRQDRLRALADEIVVAGGVRPLVIVVDLQRSDATHLIGDALAAQGADPQFMANNAGFGWIGTAAALDRDEQLAMIDFNVRMLTRVARLCRQPGAPSCGVLNVGSVAGFLPGPGMTVYYATKDFVL